MAGIYYRIWREFTMEYGEQQITSSRATMVLDILLELHIKGNEN